MRIQPIEWDQDTKDLTAIDTIYRAQRQKGGSFDVLYIYWDGVEHRALGMTRAQKNALSRINSSVLEHVADAIAFGEKVGVALGEIDRDRL